jgi:transcriptional regulator with PAS, ATPase and Fis domain
MHKVNQIADFFVNLRLTEKGFSLLDENLSIDIKKGTISRKAVRTRSTVKKRVEQQFLEELKLEGVIKGIKISIIFQKSDGPRIKISGVAQRNKEKVKIEYWTLSDDYLGTNLIRIPNQVQELLLKLFEQPENTEPVCTINCSIERASDIVCEIKNHKQIDKKRLIELTDQSWLTYKNWSTNEEKRGQWYEPLPGMICEDAKSEITKIEALAAKIAKSSIPVLILGETGTGKELIAKAIHTLSGRLGRFMTFNCSELAASDPMIPLGKIFGYGKEHGIENIPKEGQDGILVEANEGTIFLDEIADLPLDVQTNLLRVLDGYSFYPAAGERKELSTSARFIFATNKDLYVEVRERRMRQDFFIRFSTSSIELPSLRSRVQDIPALVKYYSNEFKNKAVLPENIFKSLIWYHWPGNIRELKNFIETYQTCL